MIKRPATAQTLHKGHYYSATVPAATFVDLVGNPSDAVNHFTIFSSVGKDNLKPRLLGIRLNTEAF